MERILIIGNSALVLYKFRKELIISLINLGYEVFASTPKDYYYDELATICPNIIETPVNRHGKNPLQEYGLYKAYCKIIKKIRPDIILGYTIKPNIYGNLAARKYRVPFISTVTGLGEVFINKSIASYIAKLLYILSFKHTACIFFQNNEDVEIFKLTGVVHNQQICLVPGSGVNLEEYRYAKLPEGDRIRFLYVGRIFREKGISELLEASRVLRQEYAGSFEFALIGQLDGDYEELVLQYQQQGVVAYLGFQDDVQHFLNNCHCVVLPSYREGMSNTLLEAAATGRPIIASNVSGCREVVDDGINGYLCERKDAKSLFSCMKEFLLLDKEAQCLMGKAAREKAENEFDRRLVTEAMIREITRVLQK